MQRYINSLDNIFILVVPQIVFRLKYKVQGAKYIKLSTKSGSVANSNSADLIEGVAFLRYN
jgi:hypothetical protein